MEHKGETKWVLVVEDDSSLAAILDEGLRSGGYRVIRVGTASDAMKKLGNQRFHCVLVDIRLASGSGEQIITFMRTHQGGYNYETPIIVTSGYLDVELVKRIKSTVAGILVKPFNIKTLLDRVASAVGGAEPPAEIQQQEGG
jgi:DNA-binding response OmpR family regulator